MEVYELETVGESLRLEHLTRHHQIRRAQAKLCILASARRPFPRALAVQSHANPDVRLDSHLCRDAQRLFELLEFLDHDDDRFAEPASEHGSADKRAILVTITDNKTLGILMHRERGDQFRLAPRLEPEMKFGTGIDDL